MKLEIIYFIPDPDWRERALMQLEPDIVRFSKDWHISGMQENDIAQELRYHLWRKLPKFNPFKSSLRTWSWQVMRNRKIDMHRRADDLLDSELRIFIETGVEDLDNHGHVGEEPS